MVWGRTELLRSGHHVYLTLDMPEPTQSWKESVSWLAMDYCDWRQGWRWRKCRDASYPLEKNKVDGEIYHLTFLDFHFLHIVQKCAKSLFFNFIYPHWILGMIT